MTTPASNTRTKQSIFDRPLRELTNWRPGNPLTAEHLQQPVDAIRRITDVIHPGRQIPPQTRRSNRVDRGYLGPFRVALDPDDPAKIIIGPDRGAEYRMFDYIAVGLDRITKTLPESITIPSPSTLEIVYYEITKSGTVITATPTMGSSLPADTEEITGSFHIPLATHLDGVVYQLWYGEIIYSAVIIDAEDCPTP